MADMCRKLFFKDYNAVKDARGRSGSQILSLILSDFVSCFILASNPPLLSDPLPALVCFPVVVMVCPILMCFTCVYYPHLPCVFSLRAPCLLCQFVFTIFVKHSGIPPVF